MTPVLGEDMRTASDRPDGDASTCCAPGRRPSPPSSSDHEAPQRIRTTDHALALDRLIALPAAEFWMGDDGPSSHAADGEGPIRSTTVDAFAISAHTVTNAEFDEFVTNSEYVTDAERFGWSFVFAGFLPAALRRASPRPEGTPWWCAVTDATWRAPEGPGSDVSERADHPVVHVSWNDARAFCRWAGVRLPTEAEWEYAARGGLSRARYPWGDELDEDESFRCNIWRGSFPARNTAADGYRSTAPVEAFEPNGLGLYNMVGNVWEWTADPWRVDHSGTPHEAPESRYAMRGGSHMCHDSYCNRYRVSARTSNSADGSSGNIGFRIAR